MLTIYRHTFRVAFLAATVLGAGCMPPAAQQLQFRQSHAQQLVNEAEIELAEFESSGAMAGRCTLYVNTWRNNTVVGMGDNEELLGLRRGDKIKAINGEILNTSRDKLPIYNQFSPNENIVLTVIRGASVQDIEVPCRDNTERFEFAYAMLDAMRKKDWNTCVFKGSQLSRIDPSFLSSRLMLLISQCSEAQRLAAFRPMTHGDAALAYDGFKRLIDEAVYVENGLSEMRSMVLAGIGSLRQANFGQYAADLENRYNAAYQLAAQVAAETSPAPSQQPEQGIGTGTCFAVSSKGLLVTNHHVIDGASDVAVSFDAETMVPAKVITASEETDLAVLQVNKSGLTYLPVASSQDVEIGERVFTIGFPAIGTLGLDPKFADGSISSKSGIGGDSVAYQITVPIQPGNSGGPLVNHRGQVVGVITSTASAEAFLKATGSLPQNINWAVKAEHIRPLVDSLPRGVTSQNRTAAVRKTAQSVCLVVTNYGQAARYKSRSSSAGETRSGSRIRRGPSEPQGGEFSYSYGRYAPGGVAGDTGKTNSNQPTKSPERGMSPATSPDMGTGLYVIPKPPPVGKWTYVAEGYALDNGCANDVGGRPVTTVKTTTKFYETYESQCADGSVLEFRCELGGCGL